MKKFKDYVIPKEIREDEAHLNHIIIAQAVANPKTLEFDTNANIVVINNESLEAMKNNLSKYGTVVFLHDAKKYKAQKAKEDQEAKEAEKKKADEEAEKKKADEEAKDKALEAKDKEIEELKIKLSEKGSKATEDKKTSGKG